MPRTDRQEVSEAIQEEQGRFPERRLSGGVTRRSMALGLLLIVPNTYWIMFVEGIWHSGHPTAVSLMWNVMFTLLILIGINLMVKRYAPTLALTQPEFITIYVMLALASALAGHDTLQLGVPNLSFAWHFETPENRWGSLFLRYLPIWLTVPDKEIIRGLYDGRSTLYTLPKLEAWAGPVLWWSAFILAMGTVMVCLNVLVRRQWTESEKLNFPIIQLPLALTAGGGNTAFFRNRLLLIGIAFGAGLDLLNGLHVLYPSLPYITVRHDQIDFSAMFSTHPWNAVRWFPIPLYPFLIALGFLLPTDLSFSLWFFYLFRKGQQVAARAFAYDSMPRLPYVSEQSFGAWIVILGFTVWVSRAYFREVFQKIFTNRSKLDDSKEPISYRTAFGGIVLGMGFITYFCLRAGMSIEFIIPFFAISFLLFMALTRLRAELGPPAHELAGMNTGALLAGFVGTGAIGARNLTMLPLFWWFTGRGYRTNPMPHQLEAFKMAEVTRMSTKRMALAMLLAMWFGGICAYWAAVHLSYQHGTSPLVDHNWGQWNELAARLQSPEKPDPWAIGFFLGGMAFTAFLTFMRIQFIWWPFHPVGYGLSMNFGVEYFWSCILIAWILKCLVLRYGGYRSYAQAIPLMFGVILGEYVVGAFWSAMSVILQIRTYDFCPG
ncbi:MAG: hypothetical protein IT210_18950 [Armatimonadetes bacterium]|nr:hypothetical protein [Armatimonadota bacterium]